jgi:hypothetical protein
MPSKVNNSKSTKMATAKPIATPVTVRIKELSSFGSVDFVVTADRNEEAGVAVPAKHDAQVIIDTEGPIKGELALQLMGPEQWIVRVDRETSECCSE